ELRLFQRHENIVAVIQRVADAEERDHMISLDPGRGAERRDIAPGRDQGDVAARLDAQFGGEARTYDNRILTAESGQRTGTQFFGDRSFGEIALAQSAHNHTGIGTVLA